MGNRIKEIRNSKGITQKELAALLGVTPQAVSQFEKADAERFNLSTLQNIAGALECQVRDLVDPEIFPERYLSDNVLDYAAKSGDLFISLISMTSKLNLIGNAVLKEYASLLTLSDKYTSEEIEYLKQVWDPALVDKYYPPGGRDDLLDDGDQNNGSE